MSGSSLIARAFDSSAADYDRHEANTIRRWVRAFMRERLGALFQSGDTVLELNCGTGDDAVFLARRGVRVRVVDASATMIALLRGKVEREGLGRLIESSVLANEDVSAFRGRRYDGAFSNFGLNYVRDPAALAEDLCPLVKPGGAFSCALASRYCFLEMAALSAQWELREAFRRQAFRPERRFANGTHVPVYYPRAGVLVEAFAGAFKVKAIHGLGVLIPPPYLSGFYTRHAKLFRVMHALENRIRSRFPFSRLGDGLLLEFRRHSE